MKAEMVYQLGSKPFINILAAAQAYHSNGRKWDELFNLKDREIEPEFIAQQELLTNTWEVPSSPEHRKKSFISRQPGLPFHHESPLTPQPLEFHPRKHSTDATPFPGVRFSFPR